MGLLPLGAIPSSDRDSESYPLYQDFVVLPFFILFFPSIRLFLDRFVFEVYSIFVLVFWETRHSDFVVSMAHHVTSVVLIAMSYILRFSRVGSVVLILHDGTDVFLEVGKMSRYSGFEKVASVSFVMFVLSWLILRLILYPFCIIWSTSYEVLLVLDEQLSEGIVSYYYLFNALLFCLLACNMYWWRLMFRMLRTQIQSRGQISDDVRSDSEDENDHED